jgi:hypothetical protein
MLIMDIGMTNRTKGIGGCAIINQWKSPDCRYELEGNKNFHLHP